MGKYLRIILLITFISSLSVNNLMAKKPLIVFHFDFNSVALQEDYLKHWLKKVADMGYNAVLWEIEDDVKWETCPECSSPDAFTKNQFKEIINYSRTLGLEPIPLLQTIGHAEYVLQHEKFLSFREDSSRYDCYCTSNPDVKVFLKNWINEYLDLFGEISYFHLGGDEAYAFASCNKCKSAAEVIGENKFYAEYVEEISEPILEKGIRPGVWSDMILKHPKDILTLAKEFIIWDWNYWDGDSSPENVMVWSEGKRISKDKITNSIRQEIREIFDENGNLVSFYTSDFLKRMGFDVIVCSSSRSHGDGVFAGRNDMHVDNIIGAARKTVQSSLLGNCVTSWAVRIHNYETQEPWFFLAPLTVENSALSREELLLLASNKIFKVNSTNFFQTANQIGFPFPFVNENTTGIMWTGMKDSKPAPKDYINKLVLKWNKNGTWDFAKNKIKKSTDSILTGINNLHHFISTAKSGIDILTNWSKAGYFQYWQSILANEIVKKVECEIGIPDQEVIRLIDSLKRDYVQWAEEWMTTKSSIQNAELIYDSISEFFKQKY